MALPHTQNTPSHSLHVLFFSEERRIVSTTCFPYQTLDPVLSLLSNGRQNSKIPHHHHQRAQIFS